MSHTNRGLPEYCRKEVDLVHEHVVRRVVHNAAVADVVGVRDENEERRVEHVPQRLAKDEC